MPKVNNVAKCRKSPGKCGRCGCEIEVGQPYRYWEFRYGGKRVRCTKAECSPRQSELTQSEFLGTVYALQEDTYAASTIEEAKEIIEEVKGQLEELRDETQDKFDNMPEGLQQGETGQTLEERVSSVEDVISELDGIEVEPLSEQEISERWAEWRKENPEDDTSFDDWKEDVVDEPIERAMEELVEALGNLG